MGRPAEAMTEYAGALEISRTQFALNPDPWPKSCCGGGIFMSLRVLNRLKEFANIGITQRAAEDNLAFFRKMALGSTDTDNQVALITSLNVAGDAARFAADKAAALEHYQVSRSISVAMLTALEAANRSGDWPKILDAKRAVAESLNRVARVTGEASDIAAAKVATEAYEREFPEPPKRQVSPGESFFDPPIFTDREPPE